MYMLHLVEVSTSDRHTLLFKPILTERCPTVTRASTRYRGNLNGAEEFEECSSKEYAARNQLRSVHVATDVPHGTETVTFVHTRWWELACVFQKEALCAEKKCI